MRTSASGIAERCVHHVYLSYFSNPTLTASIHSCINALVFRERFNYFTTATPEPHANTPCDTVGHRFVMPSPGYTLPNRTPTVRDITRIKLLAIQPRR